jgi:thioredoxin
MNVRLLVCLIPLLAGTSCGKKLSLVRSGAAKVAEAKAGAAAVEESREVVAADPPAAEPKAAVASAQDLSPSQFESFIARSGKLVVVDFHAPWCPPCRVLSPLLDQMAGEFGEVAVVGKVNVDEAQALTAQLKIRSIPDVRFYRDGKMVHRFTGSLPEPDLRKRFQTHAKGIEPVAVAQEPKAAGSSPQAIQPMKKDWLPAGMQRR